MSLVNERCGRKVADSLSLGLSWVDELSLVLWNKDWQEARTRVRVGIPRGLSITHSLSGRRRWENSRHETFHFLEQVREKGIWFSVFHSISLFSLYVVWSLVLPHTHTELWYHRTRSGTKNQTRGERTLCTQTMRLSRKESIELFCLWDGAGLSNWCAEWETVLINYSKIYVYHFWRLHWWERGFSGKEKNLMLQKLLSLVREDSRRENARKKDRVVCCLVLLIIIPPSNYMRMAW